VGSGGGFAHYKDSYAGRIAMMKEPTSGLPPIEVPACVRWAEHDPVLPYAWTDRLPETIANLDSRNVS
jgi:pimeloyl-ACP methyl ester carboxylesterase